MDDADVRTLITPFPSTCPTLVSTTLTGSNREIIADALRSVVDWVDWCLVIDTGIGDDTLEIARSVVGNKLVVRQFPWRNDFAAARNFALDAAAEIGAEWAVMLDTDERLDPSGGDICATLGGTDANSLYVKHVDGTYGKERFFRLPARGRYVGSTHEAFIRDGDCLAILEGVQFEELAKTPEQYRQKAERDIEILSRHTAEHSRDARWFYYLGTSLDGLGRYDEAIAAFRTCAGQNGWDEEGAWAMYRAAECFCKMDRPLEAVEACVAGMAKHAGLAELPWLAAYASWHADRPAQAAYWARQSIAMGHFAGEGASVPRIGFRNPSALWEGPYDVLRFALRRLGDEAGAEEAERLFAEAKAARERNQDLSSVVLQSEDSRTAVQLGSSAATGGESQSSFLEPAQVSHTSRLGPYDTNFYAANRQQATESSQSIVPLILDLIQPASVVDVGCGTGEWLATFQQLGVSDVVGIDGDWVPRQDLQIPPHLFISRDLRDPLDLDRTFDLAISLETAEHLPPDRATVFVDSLVRLAPAIIFSAAIPCQPGTDHLNLQWPAYWAELFGNHGYVAIDRIRPQIWELPNIPFWYAQNMFLLVEKDYAEANNRLRSLWETQGAYPPPLVHPGLYTWFCSMLR